MDMSGIVPDGIACFFPSYEYMVGYWEWSGVVTAIILQLCLVQESVVTSWVDQGIMSKVQKNKLIFIETRDRGEISLALHNYFKVCQPTVLC